jgi:hypothetical protein
VIGRRSRGRLYEVESAAGNRKGDGGADMEANRLVSVLERTAWGTLHTPDHIKSGRSCIIGQLCGKEIIVEAGIYRKPEAHPYVSIAPVPESVSIPIYMEATSNHGGLTANVARPMLYPTVSLAALCVPGMLGLFLMRNLSSTVERYSITVHWL